MKLKLTVRVMKGLYRVILIGITEKKMETTVRSDKPLRDNEIGQPMLYVSCNKWPEVLSNRRRLHARTGGLCPPPLF